MKSKKSAACRKSQNGFFDKLGLLGAPCRCGQKIFFPCQKRALPDVISYRRTSAGAEETGGCAMTGHGKRAPLIGVGLVAIAAAALLFWGAWTQAGRARDRTGAPAQSPDSACQVLSGPLWPDFA